MQQTLKYQRKSIAASATAARPFLWSRLPSRCTARSKKAGLLSGALLIILLAGANTEASADKRYVATERFTEYAKVIDVQPVYKDVHLREPRHECWTEQEEYIVGYEDITRYRRSQRARQQHGSGNALVGGLIGGVIGNQLGRGHSNRSRTGATVAGAIIGGALANESNGRPSRHRRHESRRHTQSRPIYGTRSVERCKRVTESRSEQRLQHYNVTYRYKGRNFVTQLPRDPGNRIELQVSVSPARR